MNPFKIGDFGANLQCKMASNIFWLAKIQELGLWCLMPLSTIYQLYRGIQFFFVEVSGAHRGNHRPSTCHWQTWSCNVVSSTSPHEWDSIDNFSGDRHWLHIGSSKSNHHIRVSAGFYYTNVKWPNSYKFLRPFGLKGTYSIGQLCPNLPKTYRSFNDILRCGLIH